ncbi:MAG: ATP-binding protein [Synergistaceae bacterium]|jgi:predicted AAA+ superfamily ATPase|nr:ATP-binding protein [Synergistaceae bacterium]
MYERTLKKLVLDISESFPVLLVTGPRQVGKTTLLEMCAASPRNYVTLDNIDARALASGDPALFLQTYKPPIFIDEVQYAPNLFPYIKIHADRHKNMGDFWLTGSQKYHLMKNVTESLAGRVAVVDMLGLSSREISGNAENSRPFLPTPEWIEYARTCAVSSRVGDVYERIWLGSFPGFLSDPARLRDIFYNSYARTYIERDVREIANIGGNIAFYNFLRAAAARTAQLLNYADFSRDVDIDPKTAKSWLSVLCASGLVYLLEPYCNNITKRIIKTPKLYFLDTGLAAFLTGWDSPKSLEAGAMNGAVLETFVFGEILKSYWHNGRQPSVYFYRDADQREVDFLFERDGTLYPAEVKKTATPSLTAAKSFTAIDSLRKPVGPGAVICLRENDIPLSDKVTAIPIGYL